MTKKYTKFKIQKIFASIKNNILPSSNNPSITNQQNISENKGSFILKESQFKCPKCSIPKYYKTKSSLNKHIRNFHGPKWECQYCKHRYTEKGSHLICKAKEKILTKKFIDTFLEKNDPISFIERKFNPKFGKDTIEKGPFIYFANNILGKGHFSKCYFSIDTVSGLPVALKFALSKKSVYTYKEEGIILNKLCDENFYPKLYNFNSDTSKDYLGMTLMGPDLLKILNFTKNKFFDSITIRKLGYELIKSLEYIHYHRIIHGDIKPQNLVWGIYNDKDL